MIDMKPTTFNFRLQRTALWIAWIGGAIGIGASFYSWKTSGEFATTTFIASLIAWLATVPVFVQHRRTGEALKTRHDIRS